MCSSTSWVLPEATFQIVPSSSIAGRPPVQILSAAMHDPTAFIVQEILSALVLVSHKSSTQVHSCTVSICVFQDVPSVSSRNVLLGSLSKLPGQVVGF